MQDEERLQLWREILNDIREETGLSYIHTEFDTRHKHVAEAVLPILARWIPDVPDADLRFGLYSKFDTPQAYGFIDLLLERWQIEEYELCFNALSQCIARLTKESDSRRAWDICQRQRQAGRQTSYLVLSKLAAFPSVASEVKDFLVHDLNRFSLRVGDLQDISRVYDPRIVDWFKKRIESPNRHIRNLARKVTERHPVPVGVTVSSAVPNYQKEIYSAETDLSSLRATLKKLEAREVVVPSALKDTRFLCAVDPDRWLVAETMTKSGKPASIWLRAEDFDTVQIVVTSI